MATNQSRRNSRKPEKSAVVANPRSAAASTQTSSLASDGAWCLDISGVRLLRAARINILPFMVVGAVLAIVALAPGVTLAQDGTPTVDFVTPDPAECRIAPRSIDSIASALATPIAGTPTTAKPEGAVATGQPADAETVAAVTALAREATACGKLGDYRRVFALYTDNGLPVFAADRGMTAEQLAGALAATPVPLPEESWQAARVQD